MEKMAEHVTAHAIVMDPVHLQMPVFPGCPYTLEKLEQLGVFTSMPAGE
jgi:hypothetical protein